MVCTNQWGPIYLPTEEEIEAIFAMREQATVPDKQSQKFLKIILN